MRSPCKTITQGNGRKIKTYDLVVHENEEPQKPGDGETKREKDAQANLDYAKRCIKREELDKARQRLSEVVREYAGTKSAEEAARLLKELEAKKN